MVDLVIVGGTASAHHYEPVWEHFHGEVAVVESYELDEILSHDPAVVLCSTDYHLLYANVHAQLRQRNIGTVMAFDGILEWRRTFEYPLEGHQLPFEQPAGVHKIACLGPAQARLLESWGNLGKCEIVGVPRFDELAANPPPLPKGPPRRILVMTAKTPGFSPQQVEACRRGLLDVREVAAGLPDVELVWRVSPKIQSAVGLPEQPLDTRGADLHSQLATVHAVVSTMSTAVLEAMLARRPTAVLDYTNGPHLTSASWRICAREHVGPVLRELLEPPRAKMAYQEFVLRDSLHFEGSASQRMATLLEKMVECARSCPAGEPLQFPDRIVPGPRWDPLQRIDWARAYDAYPYLEPDSRGPTARDYQAAVSAADYWQREHRRYVAHLNRIPGFTLLKTVARKLFGLRRRKDVYRA